jgi:4-amino-4-deoxy-L-arabinose transferase-like glycosyltransferase
MASPQSFDTQHLQGRIGFTILKRAYSISPVQLLLLIMSLAVILRLGSALYQGNTVTDLPGVYDQISYDGLARRVVDGFGFSFAEGHWPATRAGEPTAHWSYLYTLYLAAIYKVFGPTPLIARIIQALIAGIFQTLLVWRIGTRLFNRTVGLVAAALSAVYIYFFYYAGALITETFYIIGILWILDCAFRLVATTRDEFGIRWRGWLELGLAMGVTVLLRQVFLLFLPFLFLWLWWNLRGKEADRWKQILHWSAVKGLATATLVLALMIVPFTIRNQRAFGTFVLLNTNAGFAFFWGNHPVHGTHFIPLLPVTGPSYQDLIPPELLVLNEGALDKALLGEGIRFVLDDPMRFVLLSISRIEEYIKFWPSADSGLVSNLSRVGSFGILLPFMLHGLWMSFSYLKEPVYAGQRANLLIIYMFILVYALVHLLTWTLIRYRLPIDAFLLFFSALSIQKLTGRIFYFEEGGE